MEKAAEVHKKWVEQKRAESQARRELEHKQRVTRKHEEEQVCCASGAPNAVKALLFRAVWNPLFIGGTSLESGFWGAQFWR